MHCRYCEVPARQKFGILTSKYSIGFYRIFMFITSLKTLLNPSSTPNSLNIQAQYIKSKHEKTYGLGTSLNVVYLATLVIRGRWDCEALFLNTFY